MKFFTFKQKIYPLFVFIVSLFLIVFGLCMAKNIKCSFFLIGCLFWFMIFASFKKIIKIIPLMLIVGGIFSLIAYFVYGKDLNAAMAMANRFASIFLAVGLGMSIEPIDMTRNLSTLKMPRGITLGMLIATSFPPILGEETKRVREAMKTRGAGNIFNLKVLYRAFLIPFVMRLVNISDTLALSVETRGFSLGKEPYTIYKKELITISDILFLLGLIAGTILTILL